MHTKNFLFSFYQFLCSWYQPLNFLQFMQWAVCWWPRPRHWQGFGQASQSQALAWELILRVTSDHDGRWEQLKLVQKCNGFELEATLRPQCRLWWAVYNSLQPQGPWATGTRKATRTWNAFKFQKDQIWRLIGSHPAGRCKARKTDANNLNAKHYEKTYAKFRKLEIFVNHASFYDAN